MFFFIFMFETNGQPGDPHEMIYIKALANFKDHVLGQKRILG